MRFIHTNIVSENWKQLSDFYINVFKCKVKPPERNLSGKWLEDVTDIKNAEIQGVHLILPGYGDDGPTLEIFTYNQIFKCKQPNSNYTGFTHIAFEVENVDETYKTAIANGASPLGKIVEKQIENLGMLKLVYFRDPEGNIVEIQSFN